MRAGPWGVPWHTAAAVGSAPGTVVVAVVGGGYAILFGPTVWSAFRATKREFDEGTSTSVRE